MFKKGLKSNGKPKNGPRALNGMDVVSFFVWCVNYWHFICLHETFKFKLTVSDSKMYCHIKKSMLK